jgi:hypothetical protein
MTTLHRRMLVTLSSVLCLAIVLAWIERADAHEQNQQWNLTLQPDAQPPAPYSLTGQQGTVRIDVEDDGSALNFALSGLRPRSVHGVWLLLKTAADPTQDCGGVSQQSCEPPFLSCVGPVCQVLDPATGQNTGVYSFTPAAADTSGFTAGNGLDPNGFVTNARGDANVQIRLNYNVFADSASPLVLTAVVSQSVAVTPTLNLCEASSTARLAARVDSGYMRTFDPTTNPDPPVVSPSFQVLQARRRPRLVRASVAGVDVVDHFDGLTHGHVPGLNVANPRFASCGDFAGRLSGSLEDAVPSK